jgi:hypothetical protein
MKEKLKKQNCEEEMIPNEKLISQQRRKQNHEESGRSAATGKNKNS